VGVARDVLGLSVERSAPCPPPHGRRPAAWVRALPAISPTALSTFTKRQSFAEPEIRFLVHRAHSLLRHSPETPGFHASITFGDMLFAVAFEMILKELPASCVRFRLAGFDRVGGRVDIAPSGSSFLINGAEQPLPYQRNAMTVTISGSFTRISSAKFSGFDLRSR